MGSTYTLVIAGPWRFRMRVARSVPPAEYELEGRSVARPVIGSARPFVPIWFVAPVGPPAAAIGGAAVGVAYADVGGHLPGRPWTALALAGVVGAPLLLATVVAEAGGPIFAMGAGGGGRLLVSGGDAAALVLGCLGAVVAEAAGLGALLARRRRAAATMAVAGLAMAIGPGHNIPMLGGSTGVAKEITMLAAVIVVSSAVLVEAHRWLERPSRPAPDSQPGAPSVC